MVSYFFFKTEVAEVAPTADWHHAVGADSDRSILESTAFQFSVEDLSEKVESTRKFYFLIFL